MAWVDRYIIQGEVLHAPQRRCLLMTSGIRFGTSVSAYRVAALPGILSFKAGLFFISMLAFVAWRLLDDREHFCPIVCWDADCL